MKLVFALLVTLVGCAKAMKAPTAGQAPLSPNSHAGRHDPDIAALDREIDEAFAKMQVARPAARPGQVPDLTMSAKVNITAAEDPECKRGTGDVCTQSCTLADSICNNAKRICDIASKLENDAWANERCTNSTESCRVAHQKCCGCN